MYNIILDENCRHTDHKYGKMCLQMKKLGMLQKREQDYDWFSALFSQLAYL